MPRTALAFLASLAAIGGPAAAVTTDAKPVTVVVTTPERSFAPRMVRIPAGKPVRIVVRNVSGNDHDFHAPVFFAKAKINEKDGGKIWDGEMQVPKGTTASVRLIAAPGRYEFTSSKPLDMAEDMKGVIVAY